MLLSMTGFGTKTASLQMKKGEEISMTVEIKSLNTRFFEATCKLPSSLSFLEIPIVNLLKEKLIRGRVFISIKTTGEGSIFEKVEPVFKLVGDYIKATNMIKKRFNVSGDISISDIVSLPNALSFEKDVISRAIEKNILDLIEQVVNDVVKCRIAEGKALQKDLEKRFALSQQHINKIKELFDSFMKNKKEEIKKALALAHNGDQEAETHLGDCYEAIDKIDIHEEIVRFKSHLNAVKSVFTSKEVEKGKRFEFILQELGREINTIAAKCSNYDISAVSVDVKVELEKVREQIQNIV